jgi:glycosyltransferase involved in cell wall biosynthesis
LVRRLVERGYEIDVLTTTLQDQQSRPSGRTTVATVDGARVHALGTPLHYRWMGVTPTLPWWLARLPRPDVAHVYGFRDPVTTLTAHWCRLRGIPYVFEPLGMLRPRLRKVGLKRTLDATLYRGIARGAAAVACVSKIEAADAGAAGVPAERIAVRGNGFPDPDGMPAPADLRSQLGIDSVGRIVLYVGRIAAGKGIEHLLEATRRDDTVHLVLAGPDDRHGTMKLVEAAQSAPSTAGRVHVLPPTPEPPLSLYGAADVFVLASAGDSFGMVAAEAAAAGAPVVVTDTCGVAGFFHEDEALVVPDRLDDLVDAIRRVLSDQALRRRLSAGGLAAARRMSWDQVTDAQERIYRAAASRTAWTNDSTDGS